MLLRWSFAVFALVAFIGSPLAAAGPDNRTPAVAGPKEFAEFKELIGNLRQIQERRQLASDKERSKLDAEMKELVARGKDLAVRLMAVAEKQYLAAPNQDKNITDFLITVLVDRVQSDNYEEAAHVANLLIDNKCETPGLYYHAGVADFCTNDFVRAKEYLQKASKESRFDKPGPQFLEVIDKYPKWWAEEQAIREKEAKADDLPRVKLITSQGDIVVELFEDQAPNTTANFISLVEKHFYDGVKFHRVIPGFMAQGGDPTGTGSGGPGYTIACECYRDDFRRHFRGTLSMAHAGKDTGGSQFFLTFVPTTHLDRKHTAFGRVIDGMDVLSKLQRIEPGRPGTPDRIQKAIVVRKRNHEYVPKKGPDKG